MQRRVALLVCSFTVALLILDVPGEAQEQIPPSADLVRLIESQGVSGFEADVRDGVKSQLSAGIQSRTDEIGNLIVTLGQGKPHTFVPNQVTFAWVVEEEVGLRGAAFLSQRLRPDHVFAVDTFVSSDSPLELPRFAQARLGTGAVVRAVDSSNIAPPEAVTRVATLARQRGIPLSIGVTGGGNDGAVFSRLGAIDIPIAWPLRYSHSPVKLIDRRDLDALADLVFTLTHKF